MTDAELTLLLQYAQGAHVAMELGCYEGKTSVAIAQVAGGRIYSIDPFLKRRLGIPNGQSTARIHFVDADHTYEAVRRDWLDQTPKIRIGGCVALHDAKRTVNSLYDVASLWFCERDISNFGDFVEINSVDSLVILRKLA